MQPPEVVDWAEVQAAVGRAATRVSSLLRSVRRPDAPCLGKWSVIELAAHTSHTVDGIFAMAKGGGGVIDDLWGLGDLTGALVMGEADKDPHKLADRLDASAAEFLAFMRQARANDIRTWFMPGVSVPMSFLTCHLLNELTVHAWDIAQAEGIPWTVEPADARLVIEGFILQVLTHIGDQLVSPAGAKVRATYHLHVRGGGDATLRFDAGRLTVERGRPRGRVDCHLSVEPAAFLLVTWGRIDQWGPIARGKLLAWGRKPWLGLKLRSYLLNP